jgi:hypothetical protein
MVLPVSLVLAVLVQIGKLSEHTTLEVVVVVVIQALLLPQVQVALVVGVRVLKQVLALLDLPILVVAVVVLAFQPGDRLEGQE